MTISTKILDLIAKRQKTLEFIIISLIFISIGFSFDSEGSEWFWNETPYIAIVLVGVSLLFSLLWIKIERNKTHRLICEIKNAHQANTVVVHEKISQLTRRQKEVFELILQGKSNQDIMDALFIELSTLKTHINKIYKILEIHNRKEAISNYNRTNNIL